MVIDGQLKALAELVFAGEIVNQAKFAERAAERLEATTDDIDPVEVWVRFRKVILDSDWEAEFCRVAEVHPRVLAYVKNRNLGLEVPYRYGSEMRTYIPDFIVLVDDGNGNEDPLHLVVEIKGYRREDAKEKKNTMEVYWVPGVNNHGNYGRWAFAEFVDVWEMQSDFEAMVADEFSKMIDRQRIQTAPDAMRGQETTA